MEKRTRVWVAILLLAFLGVTGLFVYRTVRPRVIGSAVAPDGTEMCLVQRWSEGYWFTTGFYYRRPGQGWNWMYYGHEDRYWGKSRVKLDTKAGLAIFHRGGAPAVTFHWATETYLLHRWNRTTTNGSPMPQGWEPPLLVP